MNMNGSSDKLLLKYAMKNDKKEEIFHSSGYARAQAGQNFGAAGNGETFDTRKDIETDRKYIQGYKHSRITNEYRSMQRARSMASSAASTINNNSRGGEPANLMDTAMTRAKQTATTPKPSPMSHAPKIPMRRSGI